MSNENTPNLITWQTVCATVILATAGIGLNTTRDTLSGNALLLWAVATVLVAFLMTHAVQYVRLRHVHT